MVLPESGILEFGEWLCKEDWTCLPENGDPTEQVMAFEKICEQKLDSIFPTKTVRLNPNFDKPFITSDLKKLDRKIKREYRQHQKSLKYRRLKESYDEKYKIAAAEYLQRTVTSLKEDDPGKAYKCLKKMAAQEFQPLDYNLLPDDVQAKLNEPISGRDLPVIADHDVYQKILKSMFMLFWPKFG